VNDLPVTDRWGVVVSSSDATARRWWDQAIGELVAFTGDPARSARAALDGDVGFGEARAFCAYVELYAQTPAGVAAARGLLDRAPGIVEMPEAPGIVEMPEAPGGKVGSRGDRHLRAARAWSDGDLAGAALQLEAALGADPHDLLALRVAQDLYFFLGDGRSLRESAARVVRQWSRPEPGWGYVQGMYSFGLEESGQYRRAEAAAGAALDADPADVWAIHTLAHIAEMEGRPDDGIAEMARRAPLWTTSYFAVHHWWHVGLYHIAKGDYDAALALYHTAVRTSGTAIWLDLVDAASLLWRLSLYGVDVSGPAGDLAAVLQPMAGSGLSVFNDWHAVMVFGLAGRPDLCRGVLDGLDRTAGTNRRAVTEAGRAVIEAFLSFAGQEYSSAAATLFGVRARAQALGGSHAQRDVIDLTLVAAAASAGETHLVRALTDERLESRPGSSGPLDPRRAGGPPPPGRAPGPCGGGAPPADGRRGSQVLRRASLSTARESGGKRSACSWVRLLDLGVEPQRRRRGRARRPRAEKHDPAYAGSAHKPERSKKLRRLALKTSG
jgi:tetratricopeptide (TPR) repeat protein